jgi:uncharacterized Fe-S center protein
LVVDVGAKVYFTSVDAHEKKENNLLNRLGRLYDELGFASSLIPKELVAVKTHFGEGGCTRYLRPIYLARLLESLEESGVAPFLTDSNTYYVDRRHNAVEHLRTAQRHGFYPPQISAPIVIADGLTGRDYVEVPIEGEHFSSVKIASAIHESNAILSAAHFKGHVVTGFGGSIKNLGMGGASRAAKLTVHGARAKISDRCTGCGICVERCPRSAIEMEGGKGVVDRELCDSCGECSLHCYSDAIDPDWEGGSLYTKEEVQERIAEHVLGAVKGKEGKVAYFNFLLDVTPECDRSGCVEGHRRGGPSLGRPRQRSRGDQGHPPEIRFREGGGQVRGAQRGRLERPAGPCREAGIGDEGVRSSRNPLKFI